MRRAFLPVGLAVGLAVAAALAPWGAEAQAVGQMPPKGQQLQAPQVQVPSPQSQGVPPISSGNGVIRPPQNIDPGIAKQAPSTERMPVIPPPGQPGSLQPNVVPK